MRTLRTERRRSLDAFDRAIIPWLRLERGSGGTRYGPYLSAAS
jgi:hypothetical protein